MEAAFFPLIGVSDDEAVCMPGADWVVLEACVATEAWVAWVACAVGAATAGIHACREQAGCGDEAQRGTL